MNWREPAAIGALTALAILLIWANFTGRMGVVLGALLCPQQLILTGDIPGEFQRTLHVSPDA